MKAIWIWENCQAKNDEYADFKTSFQLMDVSTPVTLRLSADSYYGVYVNGELAAFGQYADFPHCKVRDTHDITSYCHEGENTVVFTVWYHGEASATYCPGKAGLFFEIIQGDAMLAVSGTDTLSRINPYFVSYREKKITKDIGFGFRYNAAANETPYHAPVATGYDAVLHPRPIKTLELWDVRAGKIIDGNGSTCFVVDLGREEAGFIDFSLYSDTVQTIKIAYAELLNDGKVVHILGPRDFSVDYDTKVGENTYLNPFRRIAGRYLAVYAENPIEIRYIGIRPTMYPVTELPYDAGSARRQQIYDVAKWTLRLCMHEHYEDCPWREQALYAMDSRNQMLCGYQAFGETEYARASLWLIAQDRREDGFLSDTIPGAGRAVIPSFGLHWYQEVLEYTEFSSDFTLVEEIWSKLCSVLEAYLPYFDQETGLIKCMPKGQFWNFYEWTGKFMMGHERETDESDLILNTLYLRAVDTMTKLAAMTGKTYRNSHLAAPLRSAIRKYFRREEGLYNTDLHGTHVCDLGNALAILTGVADEKDALAICDMLTDNCKTTEHIVIDHSYYGGNNDRTVPGAKITRVVPISLSMTTFVYDALLMIDAEKYKDYIINDVDTRYGEMIDAGATTFWETQGGPVAFGSGASLCHGWSALAIYYYKKLL